MPTITYAIRNREQRRCDLDEIVAAYSAGGSKLATKVFRAIVAARGLLPVDATLLRLDVLTSLED